MRRQHLAARAPRRKALDVVGDICGLHAQLTASAELTLWARVDGLQRDAVSRWLWKDRKLVRTWAQRGTLHLLRADELGLWVGAQSALKPRHHVGSWLRHHGLTREQADAMLERDPGRARRKAAHARGAGRRGRARDRDQGVGRQAQGRLRRPAQAGGIPRRPLLRAQRRPARALRAARPVARPLGADGRGGGDARGHAPVPGALRPGRPRDARALVRDALARRGRPLAEGAGRRGASRSTARYAGGRRRGGRRGGAGRRRAAAAGLRSRTSSPRRAATTTSSSAAERARVYRPQGWLSPVLAVDGRIAGVWSHEPQGRSRLVIEVEPFAKLSRAEKAGVRDRGGGARPLPRRRARAEPVIGWTTWHV